MCSLRLLDLSHNRIGDSGACALAAMLGSEPNATSASVPLNTLELEGNQVRRWWRRRRPVCVLREPTGWNGVGG